jgi:hypothetical protein
MAPEMTLKAAVSLGDRAVNLERARENRQNALRKQLGRSGRI